MRDRICQLIFSPKHVPLIGLQEPRTPNRGEPSMSEFSWLHNTTRYRISQRSTLPTRPLLLIPCKVHDRRLDLSEY